MAGSNNEIAKFEDTRILSSDGVHFLPGKDWPRGEANGLPLDQAKKIFVKILLILSIIVPCLVNGVEKLSQGIDVSQLNSKIIRLTHLSDSLLLGGYAAYMGD